jgi:hypothetical protein
VDICNKLFLFIFKSHIGHNPDDVLRLIFRTPGSIATRLIVASTCITDDNRKDGKLTPYNGSSLKTNLLIKRDTDGTPGSIGVSVIHNNFIIYKYIFVYNIM